MISFIWFLWDCQTQIKWKIACKIKSGNIFYLRSQCLEISWNIIGDCFFVLQDMKPSNLRFTPTFIPMVDQDQDAYRNSCRSWPNNVLVTTPAALISKKTVEYWGIFRLLNWLLASADLVTTLKLSFLSLYESPLRASNVHRDAHLPSQLQEEWVARWLEAFHPCDCSLPIMGATLFKHVWLVVFLCVEIKLNLNTSLSISSDDPSLYDEQNGTLNPTSAPFQMFIKTHKETTWRTTSRIVWIYKVTWNWMVFYTSIATTWQRGAMYNGGSPPAINHIDGNISHLSKWFSQLCLPPLIFWIFPSMSQKNLWFSLIFPLTPCHVWSVSAARLAVKHRAYEVHASHQKDNRPEEHSFSGGHRQQNGHEVHLTQGFADSQRMFFFFQGTWKPESPIWPIFNRNIYSFRCFQTNQSIEDGPRTKNKTLSKSRYLQLEVGKLQPQMSTNQKLRTHHQSMMPSKGQGYGQVIIIH